MTQTINILTIPCLEDNFSYMIYHAGKAVIVDVPEALPILDALKEANVSLEGILITHGHGDHIQGLSQLAPHCQGPIYGFQHPRYPIAELTHPVMDETPLTCAGFSFYPLVTPGHMPAHLCYSLPDVPAVFTGDVLFSLGCGRVFDGTANQLYRSLQRLADLPEKTHVYCGHEYTLSNGDFALEVMSDTASLQKYLSTVKERLAKGKTSMPTTIGQEKKFNPFLVNPAQLDRTFSAKKGPEAIFATLREQKNSFSVPRDRDR